MKQRISILISKFLGLGGRRGEGGGGGEEGVREGK